MNIIQSQQIINLMAEIENVINIQKAELAQNPDKESATDWKIRIGEDLSSVGVVTINSRVYYEHLLKMNEELLKDLQSELINLISKK